MYYFVILISLILKQIIIIIILKLVTISFSINHILQQSIKKVLITSLIRTYRLNYDIFDKLIILF